MVSKTNKTKKSFIGATIMSLILLMGSAFGLIAENYIGNISPTAYSTWAEHKDSNLKGRGIESNPYKIETAEQLAYLGNIHGGYVELVADIDLGQYEWLPIECDGLNINGNGHYIKNMKVYNSLEYTSAGFFASVLGLTVQNLNFVNVYVDGGKASQVGGVVGNISGQGTRLSNINVLSGTILGKTKLDNVGGIVGSIYVEEGYNGAELFNCNNNASIRNYQSTGSTGGIVGFNRGRIAGCINTGDVQGIDSIGGIAGVCGNISSVERCYANCTITGESAVGGVVGHHVSLKGDVVESGFVGTINLTYDDGAMSGAIVGLSSNTDNDNVVNCFAIVDLYFEGNNLSYAKYNSCGNYKNLNTVDCYAFTRVISSENSTFELRDYRAGNNFSCWAYCEDINGGFPFPKSLFAVGQFIDVDVLAYLNDYGFSQYSY